MERRGKNGYKWLQKKDTEQKYHINTLLSCVQAVLTVGSYRRKFMLSI